MKKISLKKILSVVLAGALVSTSLIGCGGSDAENGELNVYNWTEYIPESVINDFEDEYGIKVNYSTYSSNEECLAKVQSSAEGTYDVIVPSDYMITIMKAKGMLEELNKYNIPNLSNINETYLNQEFDEGNVYSVPFTGGAAVIAVNTDTVSKKITSYKDLLDSEFKDSLVLLDDQRAVIGMALKALGYSLNEVDDKKLAEAKAYLEELKPNIKLYDSDSPKSSLITGETKAGLIWNAECALAMEENDAIEVVYPEEGMYLFLDNFAIPKGAKNKENAEKFINYILEPEVSKKITEEYPYKNVNAAAYDSLPDDYKNNPASNVPDEEMAKGEYVKEVGDATAKFDKIWSEIK